MSKPNHRRPPGVHPNQRQQPIYFRRVTIHLAATDDAGLNAERRVFEFAAFRIFPVSAEGPAVLSVTEAIGKVTIFPFYRVEEIAVESNVEEIQAAAEPEPDSNA